MKLAYTLCGLLLAVAVVNANPIVKREADDLSPLNEVYVLQADADSLADGERGDRDKRKIGVVKLGVTNGIINFVFGKLDSFLDAKTKALAALDEGNKAKNAAFNIDNRASATGTFISNLISQKIQAGTASIGPLISGATTFFSTASNGLSNAIASKIAPLSSLTGGLLGGGDGSSGGGASGGIGGLLSSGVGLLSGLSGGSNLSGGSGDSGSAGAGISFGGSTGGSAGGSAGAGASAGASAFANLGAVGPY